jgi:hypothetical protein
MTPDLRGYKVTIVSTRSPILALSYWVNARSVALELFPHPWPIPCLLDIPCYLLVNLHQTQHNSPLCLFPIWPHSFSPRLIYSALLRLESQSAASCSHLLTARGLFHPEDGGDTFLRNVGLPKFYTAPHPRRQHSSRYKNPTRPLAETEFQRVLGIRRRILKIHCTSSCVRYTTNRKCLVTGGIV